MSAHAQEKRRADADHATDRKRAPHGPVSGVASVLLGLQHSIGNRAVGSLLAHDHRAPVQRLVQIGKQTLNGDAMQGQLAKAVEACAAAQNGTDQAKAAKAAELAKLLEDAAAVENLKRAAGYPNVTFEFTTLSAALQAAGQAGFLTGDAGILTVGARPGAEVWTAVSTDQFGETYHVAGSMISARFTGETTGENAGYRNVVPRFEGFRGDLGGPANDDQRQFLTRIYNQLHRPAALFQPPLSAESVGKVGAGLDGGASLPKDQASGVITRAVGTHRERAVGELRGHLLGPHGDGGPLRTAVYRVLLHDVFGDNKELAGAPKFVVFNRQRGQQAEQAGRPKDEVKSEKARDLNVKWFADLLVLGRKDCPDAAYVMIVADPMGPLTGDFTTIAGATKGEGGQPQRELTIINFTRHFAKVPDIRTAAAAIARGQQASVEEQKALETLDTYTVQLHMFDLLHREFGVRRLYGMKSGAMDGPAMVGVPITFLDVHDHDRMKDLAGTLGDDTMTRVPVGPQATGNNRAAPSGAGATPSTSSEPKDKT